MAMTLRSGGTPNRHEGVVAPKPPRWWQRHQKLIAPYVFIAPNVIVITVFMFVPIIFAFYASLTEWSLIGTPNFVGLDNYLDLIGDPQFWSSLRHTVVYTVGTVPVSMALGLAVALGLNRRMRGRSLLRSIYFVPVVISGVAVGLVSAWMFNDNYGVINESVSYTHLRAHET